MRLAVFLWPVVEYPGLGGPATELAWASSERATSTAWWTGFWGGG